MKKLLKRTVAILLAAVMVFSFDIVGTTKVEAATKPSITLKSVTNITNINARINATVKNPSKTKITKVGFILYNSSGKKLAEKSESVSYTSTSFNAWYDMTKWYGKLSANTTYKYKFYVKNSSGTYYSSQGSFKTAANPSITVNSVTNLTSTNAQINATVTNKSNLKVTKVGFILYNSSGTKLADKSESVSNSKTSFSAWYDMNKWYGTLKANTTYKYKFYVKTSAGTYYSSQKSFTTTPTPTTTTISSKINSFIKESSYKNGAKWKKGGCVDYAKAFTKYVFGCNFTETTKFTYYTGATGLNKINAGDVVRIISSGSDGHTFVVLKREGNKLYTAEGSYGKEDSNGYKTVRASLSSPGYIIKNGKIYQQYTNSESSGLAFIGVWHKK